MKRKEKKNLTEQMNGWYFDSLKRRRCLWWFGLCMACRGPIKKLSLAAGRVSEEECCTCVVANELGNGECFV